MWTTTAVVQSGIQADTPVGEAVATRQSILTMTDEAEDAVLRPADPGAWSHALRAALASRAARVNASTELADRYFQLIENSEYEALSYPVNNGSALGLEEVIRFMDKVASCPRDVTIADIKSLQNANIEDADIVRLSELNAFMAYQIRLVAGLTLLSGSHA